MRPNEVESKKGIYYDHQAPPGSLFCTDKNGDQENRIFKKIYNGELPLYKPLYKFTGAVQKLQLLRNNIYHYVTAMEKADGIER